MIKTKYLLILLALFFTTLFSTSRANDKYILFISSYSINQTWSVIIENSFRAEMESDSDLFHIYSTYMDCNQYPDPKVWLERMKVILRDCADDPPSVIVLLSDEAWITFRKAYNGEFGNVPVVLCSVKELSIDYDCFPEGCLSSKNFVPTESFKDQLNMTGVLERPEIEKVIHLIRRLEPETEEITLVSDKRFYGLYTGMCTQQIIREKFPELRFNYLNGYLLSTDSMYRRLETLPSHSSVLLASWFTNTSKNFDNLAWIHQRIARSSGRPVYTLFDWGSLNSIFMGGYYTKGSNYGVTLASMVKQILHGKSASSIPFSVNPGKNCCYLNWRMFDRFGMHRSTAPDDTFFYNRPPVFVEKYKDLIIIAFVIGVVIISGLALGLVHSRKLRKQLAASKDQITIALRNQKHFSETLYLFLQSGDEETAVRKTLRNILEELFADRVYVFESDDSGETAGFIYEISLPGIPSKRAGNYARISYGDIPNVYQCLKKDQIFFCDKLSQKKYLMPEKEWLFLTDQRVHSALFSPLFINKKLWGFIGIDFILKSNGWMKQDTLYLRSLSQVVSIGIEHFRTEAQRYRIEELFSYASENASVGVGSWNVCTGKGFATDQWFRNFGETIHDMKRVVGIYSQVHPDDRKIILNFLERASSNKSDHLQCPIRVHDGKGWRWFRYHGFLKNYAPEKNKIIIVDLNIDIDHLKKTEERLLAAKARAEESDKLKSAFLANMSHEIRTPLNAIVGFSNILAEVDNEKDKEECLKIIRTNNELLLQLINDILDLSKIEAGVMEFTNERFALIPFMREIEAAYALRAKPPLEISFDEEHSEAYDIVVDRMRLRQVITNLLNNALKFTVTGSIRFGYTVREKEVVFYVVDTGKGIPKEDLENIFQRFTKLNSFAQGTGLGLSICATIVEHWGGKISVESKEGVGSTFRFTVPLHKEFKSSTEKRTESVETKKVLENRPDIAAEKPLVVIAEDEDFNFLLLEKILRSRLRIVRVRTGIEAVEACNRLHPDLVLMDIRMPEMDGKEATYCIRSFSDVPIVAVSASAYESDKKGMIEAGCNAFIPKPIDIQLLKEVVERFTGARFA